MTLSCVAIDDEPLALEKLRSLIEQLPSLELKESFSSCVEAIPYLSHQAPDILFLDIEMDQMTGIQLLEKVKVDSFIVIISAYEQFALKGYELNVCDYVLKPYGIDRLLKAVDRVKQLKDDSLTNHAVKDYVFIKTDYRIQKLNLCDILFIEGMRDYLCLHTTNGKVLTALNFKELQNKLPENEFIRVHKSYMVHLPFIHSIEKHRIYIESAIIPISQTYRDAFYRVVNGA